MKEVPERICRRYGLLPWSLEEKAISVLMSNPVDAEAQEQVEWATGRRVDPVFCLPENLEHLLLKELHPDAVVYDLLERLEVPGRVEVLATDDAEETRAEQPVRTPVIRHVRSPRIRGSWFKSAQGLELEETPRDISFCAHAILDDRMLVVPDTVLDARFAENPLVTDDPGIRFYAGEPIHGPGGHPLGTLCVLDRHPRELDEDQRETLRDLARMVERELDTAGPAGS